jgi:hypothetical protein
MNKKTLLLLLLLFRISTLSHAMDIEHIKPSVVRLIVFGKEGIATGSGFVVQCIGTSSVVATNCHVVAGRKNDNEILVVRKNGARIEAYSGTVFWQDSHYDLALVRVLKLDATPLTLCRAIPTQGDDVCALGFPGVVDDEESIKAFGNALDKASSSLVNDPTGQAARFVEPTLSKASVRRVVSGKWEANDPISDFAIIEHDVNITSGNSGGPLLNACGYVIGVNTQRVPDAKMPMDVVRKSSHVNALIEALNHQGIHASITTAPCTLASSMSAWNGSTMLWIFAIMAAAAIGTALFFAIRRPAIIAETYTQFLRRGHGGGQEVPPPLPTAYRGEAPKLTGGWLLEGINPEAGQSAAIRLEITPQMAGKLILGRKSGVVHLLVKNTSISGQHAAILVNASGLSVEDRNSSNGTRVNGQRLTPFAAHSLKPGDTLEVGEVRLQVRQT